MDIVPQKTLNLIHRSLRFSSFCRTIPFRQKKGFTPIVYESYTNKNNKIKIKNWKKLNKDLCLHRLNFLFQLGGASFSTSKMIYALFILGGFGHVPILDLGFVTYQAVGFGSGAVFSTFMWFQQQDYLTFLNLLVSASGNDGDKNGHDFFSKLVPWIIPAVYGQSLCNSFLFMTRKNGVQYIWGLLPSSWQNGATFLLITFYEFLIPMNTWNIVLFMFYTYSSYTHYLGVYLNKWTNSQRSEPPAPSSIKSSLKCLLSYRKIQLITNLYHSCYGEKMMPMGFTSLIILVSWMSFATLRLIKTQVVSIFQPSFWIFPLGTFALFILAFCANSEGKRLFQESIELIHLWKQSKMMRKMRIVQSLQPLRANIGSFYYLKRISPLIFTSNAIGFTINLLITF